MPEPPSTAVFRRGPRHGWWHIDTPDGTWCAQMTFYDTSGGRAAPFDGYDPLRPWHLFHPDDTYECSYAEFGELRAAMAQRYPGPPECIPAGADALDNPVNPPPATT